MQNNVKLTTGGETGLAQKDDTRYKKPMSYMEDCPKCQSRLIVRYSRQGSRFIGCVEYPKCFFTAPEKQVQ